MPTDIRMPELGSEIEHADLVGWLVAPGDRVELGDLLCEIETDKATVEYESPVAGTIVELVVEAGASEIKVGELIARIEENGPAADSPEDDSAPSNDSPAAVADGAPVAAPQPANEDTVEPPSEEEPAAAPATPPSGREASPLARRVALQRGIDLGAVEGSGAHGRVLRADVEAASNSGVSATATPSAAGASLEAEIVVDALVQMQERYAAEGRRVEFSAFVIAAAAAAAHSGLGGDDEGTPSVAFVVESEGRFAMRDVPGGGQLGLEGLTETLEQLADAPDLASADVAVIDLATLGAPSVRRAGGSLVSGARIVLAASRPEARAAVRDGAPTVRMSTTLTLTADASVEPLVAARLLEATAGRLRNPLEILL